MVELAIQASTIMAATVCTHLIVLVTEVLDAVTTTVTLSMTANTTPIKLRA